MLNKKTKIILINPPLSAKQVAGSLEKIANIIPPLGIGYVAAVLKENKFPVKIIDSVPLRLNKEKIAEILEKEQPDVIAFTATIMSIYSAIESAKYLKEKFKKALFVLGGPQLTSLPQRTMESGVFDFGILGEGEYTMLELAEEIESEKKSWKKIKSLVWWKGKGKNRKIIINPRREMIENLDELPYPARELYPDMKYYEPMPGGYKRLPFGHMVTSRGCPYRCTFCDRSVFGNKFRARSPEKVIEEIEYLIKNYGIKEIKFYDDLFTKDKERVHKICDFIIQKKIGVSWSCSARVDSVDEALLKHMRKAGCWQIDYGIESGNQLVLNKMRKGITLKQSQDAVRWAKKVGMKARAFIIIGMPGETKKSIDDTINFVKKLRLDVVAFYAVMIYPGNELYEIVKKEGKLIHEDYSQYSSLIDVKNTKLHYVPEGLTEEYVKQAIKRAHKEFYLRPNYILQQALSIRSLVDIRRYWQAFKTIVGM